MSESLTYGDFELASFQHGAIYDPRRLRIEMHPRTLRPQQVQLAGETVRFEVEETFRTGLSHKGQSETLH